MEINIGDTFRLASCSDSRYVLRTITVINDFTESGRKRKKSPLYHFEALHIKEGQLTGESLSSARRFIIRHSELMKLIKSLAMVNEKDYNDKRKDGRKDLSGTS